MDLLKRYGLLLAISVIPFARLVAQNANYLLLEAVPVIEQSAGTSDTVYSTFVIRSILIEGNKKTKPPIILRELPFKPGQYFALPRLVESFEDARRQLMNTLLFHEVIVALKRLDGHQVDILVDVKERWYIFPVPYFKIIDRNINQWLVESKGSFERVNYGIKFFHNNLGGRNDKINIRLTNGYAKQAMFNYDRLYFDKQMKWGMKAGFTFGKNREVNYKTINNKQVFFKDNNYLRTFFRAYTELSYRPAIKTRHRFGIAYNKEKVSDTILALNPNYFKAGKNNIRFPELYYNMQYFNVDYIPYSLKGTAAELTLSKQGWDNSSNIWQITARAFQGWDLTDKFYFGLRAVGVLKLPFKQPYVNQQLLGYSDMYMQGYEYYVIDGVAGGYMKATFTRELLKFNIPIPPNKIDRLSSIPFRIYGKIYTNAGFVHSSVTGNNHLNNKFLYSGGVGLDIVTLYDFIIKLEWSFNPLGQNGLYLHNKSYF